MIYDLKQSVDQRLLFDTVLHSSFDDLYLYLANIPFSYKNIAIGAKIGLKLIRAVGENHLGFISGVLDQFRRSFLGQILTFPDPPANLVNLYRTLVRSLQLATLVTHSLTHSLLLSRLD